MASQITRHKPDLKFLGEIKLKLDAVAKKDGFAKTKSEHDLSSKACERS
jgi:hypothetical protein